MLAFGVMIVFAQLELPGVSALGSLALCGGLGCIAGGAGHGVGAKGVQRWLKLPGLPRFQPSEFMKLALPLMIAWYLSGGATYRRLSNILSLLFSACHGACGAYCETT